MNKISYYGIRVGDTLAVDEPGGNITDRVVIPRGTQFVVKGWLPKTKKYSKDRYKYYIFGLTDDKRLVKILLSNTKKV